MSRTRSGIGALIVLRPASQGTLLKVAKRPYHEGRSNHGQPIMQLP